MDSFPLHILLPGGDDELATVHAAALGVYALHEVTSVALAGLVGAIAGYEQRHEMLPAMPTSAGRRDVRASGLCETVERSLAEMTRHADRVAAASNEFGVPGEEIQTALVGDPRQQARALRVFEHEHALPTSMRSERARLDALGRHLAVRALLEELLLRERPS